MQTDTVLILGASAINLALALLNLHHALRNAKHAEVLA